jgi:hypothetical protein
MYFDVEVLNAPFKGLFVGVEEYIEPISADDTAPVEHFYGLSILVAGDDHFSPEGVFSVSCHEGITRTYFVTTGCFPI